MSLPEVAVKRPIFITCVVLLILILGLFSMKKMSVDLFPDVTFPIVFAQITYPGASPLDVEKFVSKPIEDEIITISGIKKVSSNNLEGVSVIIAEFKLGVDIKDVEQQIRNRINDIRRNLPDDIEEPVIRRFDPADQPIVMLGVSSKKSPVDLYDDVDEIYRSYIERVPGVSQVDIFGGSKREVHVLVNAAKLRDRKLSLGAVAQRIKATSMDVPIGSVKDAKNETTLRSSGEFRSVDELSKVNVNFFGSDYPVRLSEIAEVKEGTEEQHSIARLNGQNGLFLLVYKQSGTNTMAVAEGAKKAIEQLNQTYNTGDNPVKFSLIRDGAVPIKMNVDDVKESIIIGVILCILVVFLFLGSVRSTFITGLALPNSLLGAFILMGMAGFSINIMTLLALSLAVGLLIDDAIVVRENIFRHMEMGKKPRIAALEGTKEVTLAVIATTSVVIAVFGPISFLDGIIGQFFKQFGLTIVFAMLISTFDAFTVAPMLSTYLATQSEHIKGRGILGKIALVFDRLQTKLEVLYEKLLGYCLVHPKMVLASALAIFVGSLFLLGGIQKTFLPTPDNGEFQVTLETPVGTNLLQTASVSKDIEEYMKNDKAIDVVAGTIGNRNQESNKVSMYIHLVPRKQRTERTVQVKERLRNELIAKFGKNVNINVLDYDASGGGQQPFNLNVTGDNLEELSAYTDKLLPRLKQIKGFVGVDTNFRSGKPEFVVSYDRDQAERLGISTNVAGAELRAMVDGALAGTYRQHGREYDIRVKYRDEDKDLRKNFDTILIPNINNNMIPLSRVASGKESTGFSQINRQNKARYINISGGFNAEGSLGTVMSETTRIIKEELPPPKGITYSFQGQAEDFQDLMTNMVIAMGLGILFIYFVLSSLYESFVTPFTILLALPLAISGALAALFLMGKSLDIFSMIGMVLLLGVVAKNSILLVDLTNQLLEKGMAVPEALLKACVTRLRPILMTSFALIAGMIPIAIGLNEASSQRTSMGVAIIGGLISSTLLTLLVVPAAFEYIYKLQLAINRLMDRIRGVQHEAKPVSQKDFVEAEAQPEGAH